MIHVYFIIYTFKQSLRVFSFSMFLLFLFLFDFVNLIGNHMTCRCGTHFCYKCGKKLNSSDPYRHFKNNRNCGETFDLMDMFF